MLGTARAVLSSIVLAAALAAVVACGTEPVGVESCRKIETARCESAGGCGIDLTSPVHRGGSASLDVGACKRYYEDACLHGLVVTADPGAVAVQACVDVIINPATSCEFVKNPENHPACAFLLPPAAPPPDPAAADAAVE